MAEAVVSVLVCRLSELLIGETVSLYGVKDQIELVMLHLHQMQCFLKDADSKQQKDERVKGWVKHIRDVAYETEDAIDTFLSEIAPSQRDGVSLLKAFARKPAELFALRQLGKKISMVQAKLKIIFEGRFTFGVENLGEGRNEVRSVVGGVVNADDDDYEMVGFEVEKSKLIDQLVVSGSEPWRRVISVVGQGGLGKTTLVQKVYNDNKIKTHFEVAVWLTISSEFKLVDVLRKGLRKLGTAISKEKENDEEFLLEETKRVLGENRYLIILDDVWTKDFFAHFGRALPDVGNGSRVLMTSRFSSVAKRADPGSTPLELRYLDEDESLKLLLAKAFPCQNHASFCFTDNDLIGVAKQLARKCGGLPLALVVVGGLLSTKFPTYNDWNRALQTIDWQSDGGECMQVLATSYRDLPYYLKQCFLYMACFPEDYDIHAATLAKMWIAEGFIKHEGRCTLEDAAERCLEELTQRCMVQISKISLKYGTIERCRIHDLLRELAIDKAKEENFLQVNPKQKEGHYHHTLRRAAYFQTDGINFCKNTNLRSLLIFDVHIINPIKFRLLKVLELKGISTMKVLPNEVTNMVHLNYLGLSGTGITYLPNKIDHLQRLQTLDIRETHVIFVPVSLWEITTLRHVHASRNRPINGPPKGSKLESIITLKYVQVMAWDIGLPYMKNIRKLGIRNVDNRESRPTAELLRDLEHLCSLNIEWQVLPEEIVDMRPFRSYNNIRNLGLLGEWPRSMSFNAAMIPVHVTQLILYRTKLEKDPMPELKKLRSIRELELGRQAVTCKKMVCSAGGFPQLQRLSIIENESLEEWNVEKGSLPSLKYLWIVACWQLKMIPELQHVTGLQILEVCVMPHDFKLRIKPDGEDWHKIKHIPQVLYIF